MVQFTVALLLGASALVAANPAPGTSKVWQVKQRGIFGRSLPEKRICGPGNTCAEACGAGYITCAFEPHCYNPTAGQVCCEDGYHCDSGEYCTELYCCPNSQSLEQCGGGSLQSTIPPPSGASTGASVASSTPYTSFSLGTTHTTSTSESSVATTHSSTAIIIGGNFTRTSTSGGNTPLTRTITPTTNESPASVTSNAAQTLAGKVAGVVLGGLGAVMAAL